MTEVRYADHRTRIAILGHPIHPMLIPFPIAFLSAALVTDIVAASTASAFWTQASVWLLLAGWLTGAAAAVFGLLEFISVPKATKLMSGFLHAFTAAPAIIVAIINWYIRDADGTGPDIALRITLSAVTVILLLLAGGFGGHLVYKHRIGTTPPADEPVPTDPGRAGEA